MNLSDDLYKVIFNKNYRIGDKEYDDR